MTLRLQTALESRPARPWTAGLALIGFIVLCNGAGILGAMTTQTGDGSWYQTIRKPWFNPPGWVFGPVWTTLYTMMGFAAWLIWRRRESAMRSRALLFFFLQLALNALWTPAFFGMQWPLAGLVVIILLLSMIVTTMLAFAPISPIAAAMLIPYLLWVAFATFLNTTLWVMNR